MVVAARSSPMLRHFVVLLAAGLAACTPAPPGVPIIASAPARNLVAVSAEGASTVRIVYLNGPSIVLLHTVYMPPGERVRSVFWSEDQREAVIATSGTTLALDTRTWRVEPLSRLAAASRRDAPADGRR
jgi:hypothetical protein